MKRAIIFSLSLFSFFAVKAQLRPGDVSPTAKVIDADKLGHFNKGAAIITKGNLTALIDTAGNFIIPYGQYELNYGFEPNNNSLEDYQTGFFVATKKGADRGDGQIYINSKGKIIFDQKIFLQGGYKSKASAQGVKYMYSLTPDLKYVEVYSLHDLDPAYYIDSDGNRFKIGKTLERSPMNTFSEGIGIITGKERSDNHYITLENKLLPGGPYSTVEHFRNGYAVVGKKDEFGKERFGYINTKGEIVIPLQFTSKPESFFGNAAKVYPQNRYEFQYAFINKQGEIIYKHTAQNDEKIKLDYFKSFYGNLCIAATWGKTILSANGNMSSLEEAIKGFRLNTTGNKNIISFEGFYYPSWVKNYRNNILVYKKDENVKSERVPTSSYVDLDSRKIIDAPFVDVPSSAPYQLMFDPVSNLAYAKLYKTYSASSRKWEYTEGYINREGVFVIVLKKETSVW